MVDSGGSTPVEPVWVGGRGVELRSGRWSAVSVWSGSVIGVRAGVCSVGPQVGTSRGVIVSVRRRDVAMQRCAGARSPRTGPGASGSRFGPFGAQGAQVSKCKRKEERRTQAHKCMCVMRVCVPNTWGVRTPPCAPRTVSTVGYSRALSQPRETAERGAPGRCATASPSPSGGAAVRPGRT
jgi:hypothetical protein